MLQEGLNNLLSASGPMFSLIAGRVYAGQMPEISAQSLLPAVVYKEVHGDGEFSMDGPDKLQYSRMQFSCYGKVYGDVKKVARILRQELENFTGELNEGTVIEHMQRESEVDVFEDAPFIYCTAVDFKITYQDSGT